MIRVCTCAWGERYVRLGERFARSFDRFWPQSVELVIYTDLALSLPARVARRPLQGEGGIADLQRWFGRHRDSRMAQGRVPTPVWRQKNVATGYSWRSDANHWVAQAMTPRAAAADMSAGDVLVWLDADVETTARVPEGWIAALLAGRQLAFLGRPAGSEIGFLAFRLPAARPVIEDFATIYASDSVFGLDEQHSAFVFDIARGRHPNVTARDLNPRRLKGHPWPYTALGQCLRHDKGKRKNA